MPGKNILGQCGSWILAKLPASKNISTVTYSINLVHGTGTVIAPNPIISSDTWTWADANPLDLFNGVQAAHTFSVIRFGCCGVITLRFGVGKISPVAPCPAAGGAQGGFRVPYHSNFTGLDYCGLALITSLQSSDEGAHWTVAADEQFVASVAHPPALVTGLGAYHDVQTINNGGPSVNYVYTANIVLA